MKRFLVIIILLLLVIIIPIQVFATNQQSIPTISIIAVSQNNSVTIQTNNFPANDLFTVTVNYYGTLGIGGTFIQTWNSGLGGTQTATFLIPAAYTNLSKIAIRLQSPTSGYYSYNWFYNNDHPAPSTPEISPTVAPPSTPSPTPTPLAIVPPAGPGTIPLFYITGVSKDNTVTISGTNFTINDVYTVKINYYGTLGINGIISGAQFTDNTGSFVSTFSIPAQFYGQYKIAIRLESNSTPYYSYNWFYNNDAP